MKRVVLILLLGSSLLLARGTMSQGTYKQLMQVQELIAKNEYVQSKKILSEMLKEKGENKYERSYILQSLSSIYIFDNNYKKVESIFEEILALNAFEKESLNRVKLSLAKVYLSTEKYKKSLKLLKSIENASKIDKTELYESLILAYYYNKNYNQAVHYSKLYFPLKKEVKESWYKILYSSYVELKDLPNAITTMKIMVKLFSENEMYWVQLASLYQETNKLKKSLSTLELAYKKSLLTKKENVLYFINILLQNEVYFKASELLNEAIAKGYIKEDKKIFELLVSSYIHSKQTGLAIKKLEDSKYAQESKYQMILANLYYQHQNYQKSIAVLENMKTKKNSKIEGERYILKALSFYELQKRDECIATLKKVINNPHHKQRAQNILKQLS